MSLFQRAYNKQLKKSSLHKDIIIDQELEISILISKLSYAQQRIFKLEQTISDSILYVKSLEQQLCVLREKLLTKK